MNFIGRIFIVVFMLMSAMFMVLALAVYGTHKDWRSKAETAQQQLSEANTKFNTLRSNYDRLESELSAEVEAAVQQVRKLENERLALIDRNNNAQARLEQLIGDQRQSVAAVEATQLNNERLADEVSTLRDDIRGNETARDLMFAAALEATEELQTLNNNLEVAVERNRDLVSDAGRMTSVMRENGLNPATPADDITPKVDGFVSKTQRRGGVQLVEISIGSDDGIRKGHTVEVFNGSKYKGRIEILTVAPDRAVGRVDVRYQQGPIEVKDRVATRIKLS
ncbi:hypothetical protein Mal64_23670 [Pseudobythopirellula maris]|uniref:Chromosome partition protein Smc n=1 Tax=Pseudobythopirellula maris TaxID=2527991 RepID=A0A5C5ZN58_9BACT|nr:hypothetical protein [Pseudobythopirellula maris]TWT88879.1 hypothetical protein Mal64_23670 [Pseudobythopirellula maris]